jgi:hypothetical protein
VCALDKNKLLLRAQGKRAVSTTFASSLAQSSALPEASNKCQVTSLLNAANFLQDAFF